MADTEYTRSRIPPAALILSLAGLVPFLWGTWTLLIDADLYTDITQTITGRFVGPYVQLAYGQVILAFMSGVIWGFASRAEGVVAATAYGLSVLPALWAFFMTGSGPVTASFNLASGFIAVLLLDWMFWNQGLAPRWWLKLRVPLTAAVAGCLIVTGFIA